MRRKNLFANCFFVSFRFKLAAMTISRLVWKQIINVKFSCFEYIQRNARGTWWKDNSLFFLLCIKNHILTKLLCELEYFFLWSKLFSSFNSAHLIRTIQFRILIWHSKCHLDFFQFKVRIQYRRFDFEGWLIWKTTIVVTQKLLDKKNIRRWQKRPMKSYQRKASRKPKNFTINTNTW